MSELRGDLSKAVILLAVAMLPVQQSSAAICCCQQSARVGFASATGAQRFCCSQSQVSRCDRATPSCGNCSHTGSGAEPCRCPTGCGLLVPAAADHVLPRTAANNEFVGGLIRLAAVEAADVVGTKPPVIGIHPSPPCAAQLRAELGRYLL